MPLSDEERTRYARHLLLPELREEAIERLKAAAVLVVGAGGLGSPALFYLAAAGVGRLGVVDSDTVEVSNLQRQILHSTADIGRPKTEVAAERLTALNPNVVVERHQVRLTAANAAGIIGGYDVVVTGVDNFATRYVLNDACVLLGKTLCEAAITGFVGLAITIRGGQTACYRCLFPDPPEQGPPPGVFGPAPGVLGVIQASEAIKVVTGIGRPLYDRLLQVDLLQTTFEELPVQREPACAVCGDHPTITALRDL